MTPESLTEKFALIHEHWRPKVVAKLNGQEVKLAKLCGVFPWHHHEHEGEMFLVWRGRMKIEFREHMVELVCVGCSKWPRNGYLTIRAICIVS